MNRLFKIILVFVVLIILNGCSNNKSVDIDYGDNEDNSLEERNLKIIINEKEYTINLENNNTVFDLIKLLPLELTMNELNGNEKYVYLDKSLSTNSYKPKYIESGDVMLYGDNCLVVFYESFETPYSYTKIGHIDGLDNLGAGSIRVSINN